MHMRTKKWAKPELFACSYYIDQPETYAGKWRGQFEREAPLHLEVGCGKGVATALMAADNRDINFLAMDITTNVLGDVRRNAEAAFHGDPVDNLKLLRYDVMNINRVLTAEDRVERIYIQFCNPWTMHQDRHAKRRLTHPRQLVQYREFMTDSGEIWFKTDEDTLFDESLDYFDKCGFDTVYLTRDLHADGFQPNYESEHELRFAAEGVPIKFGIFRKTDRPITIDPLKWGRTGPRKNTGTADEAEGSEDTEAE